MKKKLLVTILAIAILTLAACATVSNLPNDSSNIKDTTESTSDVSTGELVIDGPWNDWNPDDNVTVIEGIAMASHLHATYRDVEIDTNKTVEEYRYDFNDPSILVGEFERNEHGISFGHATGKIEDGVLVVQATGRTDNPSVFDSQIVFAGLELPAKDYNKISFRMKRDYLPNADPNATRNETVEIYFSTSLSQSFSEDKCIRVGLNGYTDDLTQWFDVEIEVGRVQQWNDIITSIRFDPTNNNGVYYLDYLVLSKSDKINNDKWYDAYVDYAVENSLITRETFKQSDYNRSITRYELFDLLIKALPDEGYTPINHIKGIPDVSKDLKNADAYLMLYNAGILLGDDKGNFNGASEIMVSDAVETIDRMEHPENRIQSDISLDWSTQGSKYDIEFDNGASLDQLDIVGEYKLENGALVMGPLEGGTDVVFDSQIALNNISINADAFYKLRVRMKAEFVGDVEDAEFDFYFKNEGDSSFVKAKSYSDNFIANSYVDPAGWYIIEINVSQLTAWRGTITSIRFDPANINGAYTIDYIRLVARDPLFNASHEELISQGYTSYGMLHDTGFENGLVVTHYEQAVIDRNERIWDDYVETGKTPDWDLMPMWSLHDLWDNRDYSVDKYTLTDTLGINTIIYDPLEKSLSLRLNATKVYNGAPHDSNFNWWPHLLLNQHYDTYPVDAVKNSAAADRIFVELDIRVTDYKPTTNKQGTNSCAFPLFFYLVTDKAPNQKVWFGISLFNDIGSAASANRVPHWSPDSAAHQYMFGIPLDAVYGGIENSFNPKPGTVVTGDEWKHIRVDVTDYIDQCLEWANRDKAFGYGLNLTKEDMYFGGCNIGFEIHGNTDCTIEIKNLDMIAYNKD